MKVTPHQIAVAAEDAAELLGISERSFHARRREPGFPKPRQIGGRLRWLCSELSDWAVEQPTVDTLPEPPQLRGTRKRQSFAPAPEAWPIAGHVTAPTAGAE